MDRSSIRREQPEELLRLQRDLGMALSSTSDQREALKLILDATCRIEGIDCGGIYLADKKTGNLDLVLHRGLPSEFINSASHYSADSPQARLVMAGKPIYGSYAEIACTMDAVCHNEGLHALAVIPVKDKLKIRGALNLASHHHDEIPEDARYSIESIASQIGGVLGRLEAEASLRESQKDLKALFDSIEDFIFILDSSGNVLSINPTVEKRLGYRAENILSMHVLDFHPEAQRAEAAAIIKEMMIGNLTECPVPLLTKSGAIIPVETKVTKGRWRGRDVLIGISRDITRRKTAEEQLQRAHDELERKVDIRTAELAKANAELRAEIAEHTRTEARLQESEDNYRELFNAEPDAIIIADVENKKIVDANPSALQLYGYSYEEMCGLSALALSAEPEKSLRHIEDVANESVKRRPEGLAYRLHKRKNGAVFPVEIAWGLYSHKGHRFICAMIRDNTAREQAEEALKRSEQNFRLLIENQTDMVVKVDTRGRFLFVSPSYCKKFGKTEEELLGQTFLPLVHPDDRHATTTAMEEIHRPPYTAYVEQRAMTKDGWRWLAWMDTAILDQNKAVQAIIGVGRDVTERKTAQGALEAEKERLAVTLASIGDGVITTDREGAITLINKVAENLTGWVEHSALGQPIDQVFHIVNEQSHELCENPIKKVIESGQIIGLANNTKLIRKDGKEFIIADSGAPIISKGGEVIGVVLVFRDITEKRRMHQEILKIQKLESLGVMAGGIAHDFNNFLTGIIGNLSLVKLDITPQSKIYGSVKNIETAALSAKDLTQQLLTFSKGGKPVKSVVHLPELVTETVAFALRGSNLKCHYDFKADLELVEVDQGQIGQVLNNLVINAVQATPQGGVVTISAENVVLGVDNPMNLRPGKYVKLALTDQGTGIPKSHIDRIFDPYFSTKQKGSGLGLTVVYSIIDKHDGRITVESELGVGATFHLFLPATSKTARKAVDYKPKIFRCKGRVLVMDDEKLIRDIVVQFLTVMGFEAAKAEDGREALDMYRVAKETGHAFDAVIMDLTIPGGMGGKETIKKLLAYDPAAAAVVSSGYSNDPIMSNYEAYGFKGVIKKPYRIEDLSDALRDTR